MLFMAFHGISCHFIAADSPVGPVWSLLVSRGRVVMAVPTWQALSFIVNFEEAAVQLNTASYSAAPLMWRQSIDLFRYLQVTWLQLDLRSYTGVLHTAGTTLKWMSALSSLTCMQWNSITPDTACYNILTNAGDHWRCVLAMLEETPEQDHMSLSAAMRMCDQFDISVGKNLLSRYQNEFASFAPSASSASSSSISASILWAMARLTVQDRVQVCKMCKSLAQADFDEQPLCQPGIVNCWIQLCLIRLIIQQGTTWPCCLFLGLVSV